MPELRDLLRPSVEALVAEETSRPHEAAKEKPYLSSFAGVALEPKRTLNEAATSTLIAILRRYAMDLVLRGIFSATDNDVLVQSIGFHSGAYSGKSLDVSMVHALRLPLSTHDPLPVDKAQVECSILLGQSHIDVALSIYAGAPLPSTFWDSIQTWTPGCTFGGFTFPTAPLSRFAPRPGPSSINFLLQQDRSTTNIYAVDGMLFTYNAPSVTSYIVAAKLHQDEALSYRTLSKQQMQQWAVEKRKQGVALRRQGKREEALEAYTTAIDMDSTDPDTFVARAVLHLDMKRKDLAKDDIDTALRLDPAHSGALEVSNKLRPDPDRLRALLEADDRKVRKEKKKLEKKEKKKHKKRSRD
ncbi:hypothetical protein LEN26_017505 [Aphanomyces euteiches]|nr:hypothetical protein LEN26_017505 [Aphanomyces euteiches]KAH9111324.1 hypothetical protein AeMF1_014121 [Aphanomyces euteiches]KAH9188581.1 hypothetical protein AeNC1_009439 [Aphanomyces euteiches]